MLALEGVGSDRGDGCGVCDLKVTTKSGLSCRAINSLQAIRNVSGTSDLLLPSALRGEIARMNASRQIGGG
jgi:hypothetical protein